MRAELSILLTGGTGFIGSALIPNLIDDGCDVSSLIRPDSKRLRTKGPVNWIEWSGQDITALDSALASTDVVIHLAGRAHVFAKPTPDSIAELREANVHYTERLGRAAAKAKIRRLVYVSSMAVYGSALNSESAITESSVVSPGDDYGRSKLEAELCLQQIASETGMELVIVRPALVVGSGAPGNLERLAKLVQRRLPIPVPKVGNQRSLVTLNNLVNLLMLCARHDDAAGEVFVAAEEEWPSTEMILQWIAHGMGHELSTVSLPGGLLQCASSLIGKAALYEKVFGDLRIDSMKARQILGWEPWDTLAQAFQQLGADYA